MGDTIFLQCFVPALFKCNKRDMLWILTIQAYDLVDPGITPSPSCSLPFGAIFPPKIGLILILQHQVGRAFRSWVVWIYANVFILSCHSLLLLSMVVGFCACVLYYINVLLFSPFRITWQDGNCINRNEWMNERMCCSLRPSGGLEFPALD